MKILLKKLDRRFDGHDLFTHRAEFHPNWRNPEERKIAAIKFIELRNYLWNRFGPSVEHDLFWTLKDNENGPAAIQNPKWAWHGDALTIYLYDQALTEFLLMKERYENI